MIAFKDSALSSFFFLMDIGFFCTACVAKDLEKEVEEQLENGELTPVVIQPDSTVKIDSFALGSHMNANHGNCAQSCVDTAGNVFLYVSGLKGRCFEKMTF